MAAYSVIVTTTAIKIMGDSGTMTTLTLPDGVTFTGLPAYVARLNNNLVITNCVSSPLWLGRDLTLRLLAMPKPDHPPVIAAGSAGAYTGTRKCKVSFILRDSSGQVIAEGPLSDESNSVVFAAKQIDITSIATPATNASVSDRRVYFTADEGEIYFHAFDIEGIIATTHTTEISDAALSTEAASDELVPAPIDMDLIVGWKNRLFARSRYDYVVGTSANRVDRWPNSFPVDAGLDSTGVTGFLPRRDEMAIGRRDRLWKLTGDSEDDFAMIKLADGIGVRAPLSCVVVRDVGYFLSDDGFYSWGPDGVRSLTDDSVRPWFTTDTYFNRSYFHRAFSGYDPVRHRIVLFLPTVSTTTMNRWVELDIATGKWYGINKTDAGMTFTGCAIGPDATGVLRLIIAADDGYVYAFVPGTYTDGASTAVDMDVKGKFHAGEDPDYTHVWLEPSLFNVKESAGTVTVTPTLGDLNSSTTGLAQTPSLAVDRTRLGRLGVGRMVQLRFRQNTNAQGCAIYGYELPYVTLGRR